MILDDAGIIALYFERDERAIAHTDEKYGPSCRRVAGRVLWDRRDVDECVSDTWLHTWNAIPPKRPDPLGAFLSRITRNLALDRYDYITAKKRDTALTVAFDELVDDLPAEEGQGELASELYFREFLNKFLHSLSPTARKFFLLRYWYGLSVQEIARDSKVSREMVKSSLFRTRNRLRENMEKEGVYQ